MTKRKAGKLVKCAKYMLHGIWENECPMCREVEIRDKRIAELEKWIREVDHIMVCEGNWVGAKNLKYCTCGLFQLLRKSKPTVRKRG